MSFVKEWELRGGRSSRLEWKPEVVSPVDVGGSQEFVSGALISSDNQDVVIVSNASFLGVASFDTVVPRFRT
jgi:hypothetical protein